MYNKKNDQHAFSKIGKISRNEQHVDVYIRCIVLFNELCRFFEFLE